MITYEKGLRKNSTTVRRDWRKAGGGVDGDTVLDAGGLASGVEDTRELGVCQE